ncbi:MAG: hypothetical protein Q8O84_00145 [Nanoarchaeota archaeon]|nr:hypothetical protein [Nanoarchaeota archaeon]
MKNPKISLENLALKKYSVLLDTSVFLSYYSKNRNPETLTEKFAEAKEDYDFFVLMQNYVKNGSNFYITPLVSAALQNGYSPNFKKGIKEIGGCKNRELLKLHRKRRERTRAKGILERTFQENDKILQLNKDEQILYDVVYKKHIGLKEEYKLSESDFDFLISGGALAKVGRIVALVSNDGGIFRARKDILKKENICFDKFKFFVREDFLGFEKRGR